MKAQVLDLFNENECKFILEKSGKLGFDPSSENFVKRTKKLAFIKVLENEIVRSDQNWFVQHD